MTKSTIELPDNIAAGKTVGAAAIQFFGVLCCLVMHVLNGKVYGQMDPTMFKLIAALLTIGILAGVYIGFRSEPVIEVVSRIAQSFHPNFKLPFIAKKSSAHRLKTSLRLFAVIDFIALAFGIACSGGSESSIYTPFLFIIVPILVIVRIMGPFELIIHGCASVAIFVFGLCPSYCKLICHSHNSFQPAGNVSHAVLLAVSTGLSTFFPVLYSAAERWAELSQPSVSKSESAEQR